MFFSKNILIIQAFKTSDGELVVGAGNDEHFKILCKVSSLKGFLIAF